MRWADCTRDFFNRPELCRVFLNEHLTGTAIASQAYGDEPAPTSGASRCWCQFLKTAHAPPALRSVAQSLSASVRDAVLICTA